jgi:WD repeat-containing protein 23
LSCKISGDGKEIVGGSRGGEIVCYDLVSNRVSARVNLAHQDDINSVCFANRQHSNILLSGSDDTMVKVWDRRAM